MLAPAFYASIAGQGGYLFTEPTQPISDAQTNPSIAKYVRWIQPPIKPYLDKYRDDIGELLASLGALTFLAASLIGTSFGISVVYRTQLAQQTMVQRLYGWSLWRVCRRAFTWEAILYTLVIGFFLMKIRDLLSGAADPLRTQQMASEAIANGASLSVSIVIAGVFLWALLRRACAIVETSRNS